MDPTTACRQAMHVVLLVLFLLALSSSGHELVLPSSHELARRVRTGGLSSCLVNCEAGLMDCGIKCFLETPLKCVANCFLTPGAALDPTVCIQQCTDDIFDCLEDCVANASPSPYRPPAGRLQPMPAPLPPFFGPVRPPIPQM